MTSAKIGDTAYSIFYSPASGKPIAEYRLDQSRFDFELTQNGGHLFLAQEGRVVTYEVEGTRLNPIGEMRLPKGFGASLIVPSCNLVLAQSHHDRKTTLAAFTLT